MMMVLFVFLLLLAIALHEAGHFLTAKKFGMKVDKFFIGFGPKIWSFTRGETEYGFNWIPAGGYVRIAGMNPFEEVAAEDAGRVFKSKPAWQRAIVLAAGSTVHLLIAFLVLAALLMTAGAKDGSATRRVAKVEAGMAADKAGFRRGDTIVSVNGDATGGWTKVRDYIRTHPNERATFTVLRDGKSVSLVATIGTHADEDTGKQVGFLGVAQDVVSVRRSPPKAFLESGKFIGVGAWESLKGLGRVLSPTTIGHLFSVIGGSQSRKADDPASLVGVTQVAGRGGFADVLFLFVGFNIFIAVLNIMPLPPLDGGHLAVLAYEKVRKRDVDMRKLIPLTAVVLAVLGGLFLLTLYLDIVNPIPMRG